MEVSYQPPTPGSQTLVNLGGRACERRSGAVVLTSLLDNAPSRSGRSSRLGGWLKEAEVHGTVDQHRPRL